MVSFSGHLRLRAAPAAVAGGADPGSSTGDGAPNPTILADQSFRAPFHIGKSYWDGKVLQLRIVNATAGILEGDELYLDAAVETGASLLLTTPAASRAFVMQSGAAACHQRFAVSDGAWLEYSPEPLFPHANANYAQFTELHLTPRAECCWVESLAPGRAGRGECWAWRRLQMTLTVYAGGRAAFRERLDASGAELASQARQFGTEIAWFATAVLQSPALEDPAWSVGVRALHSPACAVAPTQLATNLWLVRFFGSGSLGLRDALGLFRSHSANYLSQLKSDLRRL
jgi:urease accessory protein